MTIKEEIKEILIEYHYENEMSPEEALQLIQNIVLDEKENISIEKLLEEYNELIHEENYLEKYHQQRELVDEYRYLGFNEQDEEFKAQILLLNHYETRYDQYERAKDELEQKLIKKYKELPRNKQIEIIENHNEAEFLDGY